MKKKKEQKTMLSKTTKYLIILLLALLTSACSRTMSYEKMVEYVNNPKNDLVQEKVINGITFKLTYRPTDMLVYQELNGRANISKADIAEARQRYGEQHYFVLSISQGGKEILSNASDRKRFNMLVNQLSFGMGESVILTTDERDTLPLLDYNSPRYFGAAKSTDILLVFSKEDKITDYLTFKINEFGMATGEIKFKLKYKTLNKNFKLKI